MDEVGERLNQLLAQPGLQGGESTELGEQQEGQQPLTHMTSRRAPPHTAPGLASLMIFMRTQLLVDEVMSLKKRGARDR